LDLIFFLFQVAKSNEQLALLLSFDKISGINKLDCWKANPNTLTKYSQVGRKSGGLTWSLERSSKKLRKTCTFGGRGGKEILSKNKLCKSSLKKIYVNKVQFCPFVDFLNGKKFEHCLIYSKENFDTRVFKVNIYFIVTNHLEWIQYPYHFLIHHICDYGCEWGNNWTLYGGCHKHL